MLNVRPLENEDYVLLCDFWKSWGWDAPTREFLPQNGCGGLIVLDETTPVVAGFLYITNSECCWVDWIISNKEYTNRKNRQKAINLLLKNLIDICSRYDCKYVFTVLRHERLIDAYKENGFMVGDKNVTTMLKKI